MLSEYELDITDDDITETAAAAIRLNFNPSGSERITKIKFLAAALITEYEKIRDDKKLGATAEANVAIINVRTASMWAVLAATKDQEPI